MGEFDEAAEFQSFLDQSDQEFINKQKLEKPMEPQEQNAWTSIDLYYKGFHVKKSIPNNVNRVTLIAEIEDLIKAGFQPSWNQETNKTVQAPVVNPAAPKQVELQYGDEDAMCPVHNVLMTQKEGKYGVFWSHKKPDGVWCNGRNTKYNQ